MTEALDSGFRRNDEGRTRPTEPFTVILKEPIRQAQGRLDD